MVGLGGLEPPTSPLSGARSSHLSYRPKLRLVQTIMRQLFTIIKLGSTTSLWPAAVFGVLFFENLSAPSNVSNRIVDAISRCKPATSPQSQTTEYSREQRFESTFCSVDDLDSHY